MITGINIKAAFSQLEEFWSPQVIAEVNDSYVKVAKLKGSFTWHQHDEEDELFFIVKGQLKIEFRDRTVELNEGDFYVVPKSVEHNPIAEEECHVVLFEKKTTQHTGNTVDEKTKSVEEQLKAFKKGP